MIVCLRTVVVPADVRHRYIDWIAEGRQVRQAVDYRPITRYDVAGGYLNLPGLNACPESFPDKETSP